MENELDLSKSELTSIPSYVIELKNLERLNLSFNSLESLPNNFDNLNC